MKRKWSLLLACLVVSVAAILVWRWQAQRFVLLEPRPVSNSAAAGHASVDGTMVVLVRHAETSGGGQDPPLNDAGKKRAAALAQVLRIAEVKAVYVSDTRRSKATVGPMLEAIRLMGLVVPLGTSVHEHVTTIVNDIRDQHAGECVLVVGDTNTIPLMLEQLGVVNAPSAIDEGDHDSLYMVELLADGKARLVVGKYRPEGG